MSIRTFFGNVLLKLTDAIPAPPRRVITDPFNYLLDCSLQKSYSDPSILLAEVRKAFPAITEAEYEVLMGKLAVAQKIAVDLASAVNKHKLTQDEAYEHLRQAIPQLNAANTSRLLMQNLIGTR